MIRLDVHGEIGIGRDDPARAGDFAIAGVKFPPSYRRALERYRYGAGSFKVDWALDAPRK